MLHVPPTNLLPLDALQEPYKKAYLSLVTQWDSEGKMVKIHVIQTVEILQMKIFPVTQLHSHAIHTDLPV